MAEKQTPDPRRSDTERRQAPRDIGDRRPAPPRNTGDRRQAPPRDFNDRRTPPARGTDDRRSTPARGMDSRRTPPARGTDDRRAAPARDMGDRRPAQSRITDDRRQTPSRRNDVIRCENCGEDYSVTYKRCPFCDERPIRGGGSGRRVVNTRGGGYGRPASTLKIAGWIISFAVILCAAFIVIRFMGAPIFGGKKPNPDASASGSQGSSVSTQKPAPQPSQSSGEPDASGNPSAPPAPAVEAIVLNTLDFTLDSGASSQLTASLLPAGVEGTVTWSSSDPNVATVNEGGTVTNVNAGSAEAKATITASCGQLTAQCTVSCKGKTAPPPSGGGTYTPGTTVRGTIIGADTGLNIRSGPGTTYEKVASASNGAEVTVLGEENGWYHIRYSGTSTGYVSTEFVLIG